MDLGVIKNPPTHRTDALKEINVKKCSQLFFKGLLAILPIALTLYVLYWLGSMAESSLGYLLKLILPNSLYVPGMGLIAGVVAITAIGLLVNAYVFQRLVKYMESIVSKIPLAKTIYSSIKDLADFASGSNENGLKQVVMVNINPSIRVLGFLTNDAIDINGSNNMCSVYVPLSYQIGGVTLLLPADEVELIDMDVKEAMQFMLTAGISKKG